MKKVCYIFCHGFGFDPTFWRFLAPYFQAEETFYCDLGYFGEVSLPEEIKPDVFEYVGIGHSLGLAKLLALPIPWVSLVGLHGFTNFLGYDSQLRARRVREWQSLRLKLKRSPVKALQGFYERAGVAHSPAWEAMDLTRLLSDFEALSLPVQPRWPLMLLGSESDVIVPPVLLDDNLRTHPEIKLDYVNYAKHNLGYVFPELVLESIKK